MTATTTTLERGKESWRTPQEPKMKLKWEGKVINRAVIDELLNQDKEIMQKSKMKWTSCLKDALKRYIIDQNLG